MEGSKNMARAQPAELRRKNTIQIIRKDLQMETNTDSRRTTNEQA